MQIKAALFVIINIQFEFEIFEKSENNSIQNTNKNQFNFNHTNIKLVEIYNSIILHILHRIREWKNKFNKL